MEEHEIMALRELDRMSQDIMQEIQQQDERRRQRDEQQRQRDERYERIRSQPSIPWLALNGEDWTEHAMRTHQRERDQRAQEHEHGELQHPSTAWPTSDRDDWTEHAMRSRQRERDQRAQEREHEELQHPPTSTTPAALMLAQQPETPRAHERLLHNYQLEQQQRRELAPSPEYAYERVLNQEATSPATYGDMDTDAMMLDHERPAVYSAPAPAFYGEAPVHIEYVYHDRTDADAEEGEIYETPTQRLFFRDDGAEEREARRQRVIAMGGQPSAQQENDASRVDANRVNNVRSRRRREEISRHTLGDMTNRWTSGGVNPRDALRRSGNLQ